MHVKFISIHNALRNLITDPPRYLFQNPRKIPSDPPERIHKITQANGKLHPDSPFSTNKPIKPMAKVTLTKLKEVCGGEGSQSGEDNMPSTEDLIHQMKEKMMINKKLGECTLFTFSYVVFF